DAPALREGRLRAANGAMHDVSDLVSCGPVACGTRVAIVDPDTHRPAPHGQIGEIWLASPGVARGYWRREAERHDTLGCRLQTGEGPFLRTGDLGVLHDDALVVTGRLKDLLIVRGLKHYPQDIEHSIERSHDSIRGGCSAAFAMEVDGAECVGAAAEVD